MALFEDILLTSDYDCTLTRPDKTVPEQNLEAIRYFIDNGGSFTVNTGRSAVFAKQLMEQIPANVPFLLMNGSLTYYRGEVVELHPIDLEPWSVLGRLIEEFPQIHLVVHGTKTHYILYPSDAELAHYERMGWSCTSVLPGDDVGVFAKFVVRPKEKTASALLEKQVSTERLLFDAVQARIEELWGDQLVVYRSHEHLLDVHAKGTSKLNAARALQTRLGKKILICVGDARNDIPMLDGADYAYCPADGAVADRYETVCSCAEGAVADVIYRKLPSVLAQER